MNDELHQPEELSNVAPRSRGPSRRKYLLSLLIYYFLFALFVSNLRHPALSFTIESLNTVCFVVAAFLPAAGAIAILRLASTCTPKWIRVAIQIPSALWVLVTVLIGFLLLAGGASSRIVFRSRLLTPSYTVTAYADEDGIEIYQERILLPGIALVRRLDSIPNADQPKIESVGKNHARVTIIVYEEKTSETREDARLYDLKPFVYF
jgi:hypothetical protein